MENNPISTQVYFEKGTFVIPEYQRGYKWSVKEKANEDSSLEYFIKSLKTSFENNVAEYFIEAVTVVEKEKKVILVDGQQRTTSLYLLFAVLNDFKVNEVKLIYEVREDSHKWLNNLVFIEKEKIHDEDTQDIFYFKKAIEQIHSLIEDITQKVDFKNFVFENVKLLYNKIPEEKAVNTFIALNGLRAKMKDEELIKSDLLIKSSRLNKKADNIEELFGLEWKINEERSRLARNWDKWLYWWNQQEVKNYYGTGNRHPLYYLLVTYWNINSTNEKNNFTFENFKNKFISTSTSAKLHFEGLRKLQKTFEDLYNNFESHNFLGLILKTSNSRENALQYFLDNKKKNKIDLKEYSKWALVNATHLEIINNTTEKIVTEVANEEAQIIVKDRKAYNAINLINEKYVYWDENDVDFEDGRKENAFRFLLLLNLLEDNKLERKFDFSIWNNRSLEHIYPKSKQNDLDFSKYDTIQGSVHCIGNLVLLYGRNNSEFGANVFSKKKDTYFNTSESFKSRNLLHTISVFANSEWKETEIINNKSNTFNQLLDYYGIKK